ncbi:hypothetical protein HF874_06325 [Parabacteroides distasonis]|uniref:hypothetical protein n=1 Tax=Parabacteroides distasonis TaxID=823 RepID=UPI0014759EFB|nr:hypothetical protein [Parabacteroides distasonis]NME12453.1 hypothetical protein [Parabacteroides distasonis]
MNVKDRIFEYLKYEGVSITKAESLLCWSKGALLKSNSISSDRLGEFCLHFHDVSPEWLLTGKVDMLKKPSIQDVPNAGSNLEIEKSFLEKETFYLKLIGEKTDDLIKAKETIAQLRVEIEDLKRQVESAGRDSNKPSIGAVKHRMG